MKITFVAHACLLIEVGGLKILTDPWIDGASWGGNLWIYPPAEACPEDFTDVDVIYFSHAHEDHFQLECVNRLPAHVRDTALTIIPNFDMPYFDRQVRSAGFKNVQIFGHNDVIELGNGVRLHCFINDVGADDSSIVLEGEGSTVFMQTDNVCSIKEARRIGGMFDVDLMFGITNHTGIFPAFCDLDPETMIEKARRKRESAHDHALGVVAGIAPRYVVPYASDLCYLGELFHVNSLHHDDKAGFLEKVSAKLPDVEGFGMTPGDWLELVNGEVVARHVTSLERSPERLATFAIGMEPRVHAQADLERRHISPRTDQLGATLIAQLEAVFEKWARDPYRVLWRISEQHQPPLCLGHVAGGEVGQVGEDWPYDLRIDIPAYRLRRLAHREYPMGFLTLQNGGMRFHRHADQLTDVEAAYWQALLGLRLATVAAA